MMNSIIIVDDSVEDQYITERCIKKAKAAERVISYTTAHEALELFENAAEFEDVLGPTPPPVMILLDINMPMMNGFEFLERLTELKNKGTVSARNVAVVMYSSSRDERDRTQARSYELVRDYAPKHLTVAKLQGIVQTIAGSANAA